MTGLAVMEIGVPLYQYCEGDIAMSLRGDGGHMEIMPPSLISM